MDYNIFKKNVFSQNGEDGILEEIIKKISDVPIEQLHCVEFGAWDGKQFSNTFNLVMQGSRAVYIEGSKVKFKDLLETAKEFKKIIPINAFVDRLPNTKTSLDNLIKNHVDMSDYDILSIDIDSYDLEVWHNHTGNPKIVIIEINSSVKPGIFQWHGREGAIGNSFSSTLQVAKKKGYSLVCHTGNMIFVRNDLTSNLNLSDIDLEFPDRLFNWYWVVDITNVKSLCKHILRKVIPNFVKDFIKKLIKF